MSEATMNGRLGRKQLSDQLDRLDKMIDVLGTGLNEAVATAVKDGAKSAVQEILAELLSNPETLNLIRGFVSPLQMPQLQATAPQSAQTASTPSIGDHVRRITSRIVATVKAIVGGVKQKVLSTCDAVKTSALAVTTNWRIRRVLVVGGVMGVAAVMASQMSHPVATTLAGIGGAATAVAVQCGLWLRAAGRRMGVNLLGFI
jgi:hypothetical protein